MKVLTYEARNFMRVSEIDMDLEGKHLVVVGGKNGHGKTSALTALKAALCGKSGMDDYPEVALKDGEDKGWVKVELKPSPEDEVQTGLTVELLLKRKLGGQVVEQLKITDEAGRQFEGPPRALLQRMFSLSGFNPLAFARMKKAERRELLLRLVGLDFAEKNKLYETIYKEREAINRDGKSARARYDAMPEHREAPEAEVSVSSLVSELERRNRQNDQNNGKRLKFNQLDERIKGQETVIAALDSEIAKLRQRRSETVTLKEQLIAEWDELGEVLETLKDESEAEVRQQIANAETVNRQVRENANRLTAGRVLEELRKKSAEMTAKLEAIVEEKAAALKNAQWPVPGLSVDDAGVLLDGLPFEQASKSKRIITSAKIGMALKPRLKLMVCEDGSDLDAETMQALDQLLKEGDFTFLMELVTRGQSDEDLCAVVVEEGRAKRRVK